MFPRDLLHGLIVEEQRRILGLLHVQLDKRLRSERGVRRHSYALSLSELD